MIFARGGTESFSCKSQVKSQVENFLNKTDALFAKSNDSCTTELQVLCATSNVQQVVAPLFAVVDCGLFMWCSWMDPVGVHGLCCSKQGRFCIWKEHLNAPWSPCFHRDCVIFSSTTLFIHSEQCNSIIMPHHCNISDSNTAFKDLSGGKQSSIRNGKHWENFHECYFGVTLCVHDMGFTFPQPAG